MKNSEKIKQGKRNRRMGANFERRTRKDLEQKGWFVSKYQNNLDLEQNKMIPAKASRFRLSTTGFPDFIAYKMYKTLTAKIMFVECKINGKLSKIEKEKANWYLKNNVCSKFFIASKYKENGKVKINYEEIKIK